MEKHTLQGKTQNKKKSLHTILITYVYHWWLRFLSVRWAEVSKHKDWNYLRQHLWSWCLLHVSIFSFKDLWGKGLSYRILYLFRRNRLNEIVDLAGKLEDWKRALGKWSRLWNWGTMWWSFSQQLALHILFCVRVVKVS